MKAALIALTAILLFDVMGLIIKHLGDRYSAPQLSMFRNLFGLLPSLLVLQFSANWHASGKPKKLRQWKLALFRGGLVAFAQLCFYVALTKMEFATVTTIAFAGPLFVTALSIPILGHQVGVWRWIAVLIGFAGVVMVMQPTDERFSWFMLLPLGAAFGYASSSVSARLFEDSIPTALINLYATVGSLIGSVALIVATQGYSPVASFEDWLWLLAMGMAGGTAVFCLISAYRLAEPSSLSPFEYFGIPFSFVLGWIFFAEAPLDRLLPGVFLIVGGGLLIVWREQLAKQPQAN